MTRFKGQFCWHGQSFTLYRYAKTIAHAKSVMIRSIANEVHVEPYYVNLYFVGKDNYNIKEVS